MVYGIEACGIGVFGRSQVLIVLSFGLGLTRRAACGIILAMNLSDAPRREPNS